jgi:hypothetical protein
LENPIYDQIIKKFFNRLLGDRKMADQIDLATASELFDTRVTIQYQNQMRFGYTIDERHGTSGTTLNVPVSDLIEMQQGNFAPTNIPVTPVEETNVPIVTKDYRLKTVIGGGQRTLFNYDKITNHADLHARAGGRNDDFVKVNAIFSNPGIGSVYTIPVTVGVNTGINQGKMSDAVSFLEAQGMDVYNYALSMWRIVNDFYNDVKPLTNNRIQTYLDVDCRFVGENGINRIPSTGAGPATYLVPIVHRDAVVQSYNRDLQTSITWVPQEDRWELLTTATMGAEIIQLNGIALMTCQDPFAQN